MARDKMKLVLVAWHGPACRTLEDLLNIGRDLYDITFWERIRTHATGIR